LFIGDIFGPRAVRTLEIHLQNIIKKFNIDFVIAQGENVSSRKGMVENDYLKLKKAGINVFTMGNHVWAKPEIKKIINNGDIVRPYNIGLGYQGQGTGVYKIKDKTIRVTCMLGITFNELTYGWDQRYAENFFDSFEEIEDLEDPTDFHILDFHAETTSEKNVFGLFLDGKVDAMLGTHTHVQTNDEQIFPKGTAFISDVGMTGPILSAIGADWKSVYSKMRYGRYSVFKVAETDIQINAVLLELNKFNNKPNTIQKVNLLVKNNQLIWKEQPN
ncbi:MAG: YmdB family metallophosphoesterase, partial [Mycoplasma sp.]|nr:YmdB family metallophosphoesterase [Mycoplasma sp.]